MPFPSSTFERFSGYDRFLVALENEQQKSGPQSFHPDIKELFGYSSIRSTAALDFHSHPVPKMVLNYMQKHEDQGWRGGTTGHILFPNIDRSLSPAFVGLDGLSHNQIRWGGVGLTMKALHYNFGKFADNCNTDKFNNEISTLNGYFNDNAALLFAEYVRHTAPATKYSGAADQYLRLLCSRPYRQIKAAELASGNWQSPDLEIFNHFVKLKACGASEAMITSAYNTLTSVHPVIHPSVIRPIRPDYWKQYRGWLSGGSFDYTDINAQNLGTYWVEVYEWGNVYQTRHHYLCKQYMESWGYWKEAPSSSCFPGDTLVLLADGQTRRALRDMSIGDEVQTMGFCGPPTPAKAKVAFVSKVPRNARNLYELDEAEGIYFTSTHPLILRGDSEVPTVGFVDPDLASSLNPTWHSIVTKKLASVKSHAPPNTTDETLYDLLLESDEHPDHPSTYTLISPSGKQLEVASEAPVMAFFPYAACFFSCVMEEIEKAPATSIKKLLARCSEGVSFASILNASTKSAWSSFTTQRSTRHIDPHTINVHTLFASLPEPEQLSAAILLESIIGLLGRSINDSIDTAWLNTSVSPTATPHLILHTLSYLSAPPTAPFPHHNTLRIVVTHEDAVLADEVVTTEHEGWTTFELQHAVPLANMPTNDPEQPPVLGVTVHDAAGQQLFAGRGALRDGVVIGLAMGGLDCAHDALFKVQLRMVDVAVVQKWQGERAWGSEARCAFAGVLGSLFVRDLLDEDVCRANQWSMEGEVEGADMDKMSRDVVE